MRSDTGNDVLGNLAWAFGLVTLALFGQLAKRLGYLDQDTVTRLVTGAMGLMVAWLGNRIPKAFVPNACARQARRFAGWAMTLSGLLYAGLFAFASLHVAFIGGPAAIIAGLVLTLAYCLLLRGNCTTA